MAAIALAALLLWQGAPGFDALVGDYQLVPGESDSVAQAIERVVARMSFLTRGAARTRIAARCIAYPAVHISREGEGFRIRTEQGSNVVLTPGGAAVQWKTSTGESVQIRLLPDFRQIMEAKDGQRENHFSVAQNRLVIAAKLSSKRLPAPVQYKLVYRRQ